MFRRTPAAVGNDARFLLVLFFHEKFQCEKIQLFMGYTIFPYALKLKKNRNLIILNATFPVFFHLEFVAGSVKPLKILRAHNTQ